METEFTTRHRDILLGIARGLTDDEIANQFSISVYTVRSYVRMICALLGAANRARAIYVACSRGIIPLREEGN